MTDDAARFMSGLAEEFVKAGHPNFKAWQFRAPEPIANELRTHGLIEQVGAHGSPWILTAVGHAWVLDQS